MHILVIDNETIRINDLKTLLGDNTYDIIKVNQIKTNISKKYQLIILSGSSKFPVLGNEKFYKKEIALIKNSTTPILGICLGFELIAHIFGAKLELLTERIKGKKKIIILKKHYLFKNISNFFVYESHRWIIKKAPKYFTTLARSKSGLEIIKHDDRNLFAFQFHPSVLKNKTCGNKIFNNLLSGLETQPQ